MTKKFQNLIGFPVRLYDATLDIVGRGLRVLGVPLGFTIGGVHTSLSVTANALSNLCAVPAVPPATTAPMNIYLATAPNGGNDTTGDGTITKPFLTFTKALSIVPRILRHKVTLFPGAGLYSGFPKDNFFTCEGGQLIFDGSTVAPLVYKANQVIDSIVSIGSPETPGTDQAWKITGLAAAWGPNSYAHMWVVFKSGALIGRWFPIWRNTATELIIGMGAESAAPADIFDIVFLNCTVFTDQPINFDFNHERDSSYFSFSDPINLGIAGISFAWSAIPSSKNLMVLKNVNCSLAATNIMSIPDQDSSMLTAINADINARPVHAGTFQNVVFNTVENNWFNCPNDGGSDNPIGWRVMWQTDSAICQFNFPGEIWVNGTNSNVLQTALFWMIQSPTIADLRLYNIFFDSRIAPGYQINMSAGHLEIRNCFLYDGFGALQMSNSSSLVCTWFKMRAGAIRGDHAMVFQNGFSGKIQAANFDLLGVGATGKAVKFIMGDQSEYDALAAPAFYLRDAADCYVHSV